MNFKFSNPMPINFPTDTVGEEFGSSDDEQPPVDDEYLTINNRAKINLIKPKIGVGVEKKEDYISKSTTNKNNLKINDMRDKFPLFYQMKNELNYTI